MQPPSNDPLIGTPVLGGYVITGLLGAGGMGSVYVAEHQRIGKKVAVKVLHTHMVSNRDIVARFLAEARAASALDHPNIIEVIDAATLDDGRDYIALEYLDGEALDDYLRSNSRLPPATALRILSQAFCGLEAAHHRGIIHRDLKPANLFIAPSELEPLRTKVLDFGIAKLNDTVLAGGVETGTGAVAGTPGYMAPEQARGMRNVDHRADIYAMGAVAYRMMSGHMPFDGESLGEIIFQQLSSPPANLRDHRPDLDLGWVQTIMASLGAEPNMRPPSCRDFVMRLAEATPGGMELVRQVSPLFFSPPWIERNRALVARVQTASPAGGPAAPGGTATLEPQSAGFASTAPAMPGAMAATGPQTTLSSAVGLVANQPAAVERKRSPLVIAGVIGSAVAAVAAVSLAVAMSSGETTAAAPAPDAAPETAGLTPDAAPETAPVTPDARAPELSKTVVIDLAIKPTTAAVEVDGRPTKSRQFERDRDSVHEFVISRRGYKDERLKLTFDRSRTVEIELAKKGTRTTARKTDKTPPETKTETTRKGPVSTDLGEVKKGPTTTDID